MTVNPILLITKNTLWICVAVVIGFIAYKLMQIFQGAKKEEPSKEKTLNEIKTAVAQQPQPQAQAVQPNSAVEEKDNPLKRMKRGFGVMKQKLQDSDFAKNAQSNKDNIGLPSFQDFQNNDANDALGLNDFYDSLEPGKKKSNKENYWNPTGIDF